MAFSIESSDVDEVEELFSSYVEGEYLAVHLTIYVSTERTGYESLFYGGEIEVEKSSNCRMTVHNLQHVAQCIRQNGPLSSYSQYSCERLIGRLKRSVASDTHPYVNLVNNARKRELAAVITNNTNIDTLADHTDKRPMRSQSVTVDSELYGPMRSLPFNELEQQEQIDLRHCFSAEELEHKFHLSQGQM